MARQDRPATINARSRCRRRGGCARRRLAAASNLATSPAQSGRLGDAASEDAQLRAYAEERREPLRTKSGRESGLDRLRPRLASAHAIQRSRRRDADGCGQVTQGPGGLGEYGKALADAGELAQAKDVLTRAYTPDNPRWDVMSVQGAVADRLGDHTGAMQFYRDALKIAPGEPSVLTNMGLSLALAKRLPEAERTLREAVASPKADARMRGNLALVLALEGKFAEAEKVSLADLSPDAARANMEAIKRMIARSDSWRELRQAGEGGDRGEGAGLSALTRHGRRSTTSAPDRRSVPRPAGRIGGAGFGFSDGGRRQRAVRALVRSRQQHRGERDGMRIAKMGDVERLLDIRRRRQAVGQRRRRQEARSPASACKGGAVRCWSHRGWPDRGGYDCNGRRPRPVRAPW